MKGYPKYVATVTDYENMLADPEFRGCALVELTAIRDTDDSTVQRVVDELEDGTEVLEEIENPMPLWRIKGFSSREAVAALIRQYGGEECDG